VTTVDERLSWVPRLHPEAGIQAVQGTVWAATADQGLHSLDDASGAPNPVAARIVELVDGKRSVGDIASVLCEEFEVEPRRCAEETAAFVSMLVQKKVLVR